MQLSVIIISFNVKFYLEQCLHAVLTACKNIQSEIIVVDNASEDNSLSYLRPKFSQIHFIQNEVNTGFSKANNQALHIAKGKYILYLNPDTILSENIITNCISFFEKHAEAGAAGLKMIDGNGNFLPESKRAFPSVMASFFKLSGMAALFPQSSVFNKYALGNLGENNIHESDVLSGAFFLSTKKILLSLNGFDEDYFMYGEDIDLSYRIQKSGYKNFYLGNNVIIHFKGESTQKNKTYVKNFYGAMQIFVNKHYKSLQSFLLKPAITTGALFSSAGNIVKRLLQSTKKEKVNENFILLGDEEAVASAAAILSANQFSYKICKVDRLSANNEQLKNFSLKTNLVFCIDKLTYADCIQFVQSNKSKFVYHWHYAGSFSIVSGSNTSAIPQIYVSE